MGSLLDITERKRARELVRQQEEKLAATARLVTMGEMASTIAHELNQPLSAIASYTAGCLNLLDDGGARGEVEEALRKTAQQAQRAGRIIRRVHDFVRKSEPTRTRVRMSAVVEEAAGFAEADARKRRVRIQRASPATIPELQADPLLLQQVVLNLLSNAMDAMAATPPEEREIRVATDVGPAVVTVSISDRGCGVPPALQERLFEPFFTTKAEGMGIGLNICRSIVELHRGRLWAEPNPGRRHRVLVLAAGGMRRDRGAGNRRERRATVHVVDDDDAIRDALAWLLRSRGVPARCWAVGRGLPRRPLRRRCAAASSSTCAWTG